MATTAAGTTAFSGFSREGIDFLADLAANNDRAWFTPRKADYERLLKQPLEALCAALDEEFRSRDIPLSADPAKSPMRIYRDVRFSKDKSPYKTNIAAGFGWRDADGTVRRHETGAGGYFHFQPGEMYVGGGMWQPPTPVLQAWRALVVGRGAEVHRALDDPAFVKEFGSLSGDAFKRVPSDAPADHPDAALLKLRQLTFGQRLGDDDVLSPRLPTVMADLFAASVPVLRLLEPLVP